MNAKFNINDRVLLDGEIGTIEGIDKTVENRFLCMIILDNGDSYSSIPIEQLERLNKGKIGRLWRRILKS